MSEEKKQEHNRIVGTFCMIGILLICAGVWAAFGWPAFLIVSGFFALTISILISIAEDTQ